MVQFSRIYSSNLRVSCISSSQSVLKPFKRKLHIRTLLFVMLYKVVLTFESVDEILKCDHSNESHRAVVSCGAVYSVVQGGSRWL